MHAKREPITAIILSANIGQLSHLPSRSIFYMGELQTPEGIIPNVPFKRPVHETIPVGIHAWPLSPGSEVMCWRTRSTPLAPPEYFFQYAEMPLLRTCAGAIVPRTGA